MPDTATLALIERLGFPGALVLALLIGAWHAAPWLAGHVDRVITSLEAQTVVLGEMRGHHVIAQAGNAADHAAILAAIKEASLAAHQASEAGDRAAVAAQRASVAAEKAVELLLREGQGR